MTPPPTRFEVPIFQLAYFYKRSKRAEIAPPPSLHTRKPWDPPDAPPVVLATHCYHVAENARCVGGLESVAEINTNDLSPTGVETLAT